MEKQNSGSFSSRTKLTNHPTEIEPSVVPQPVLAVQSVIRFQAVHMYIRLCVLQARRSDNLLSRIQCTASPSRKITTGAAQGYSSYGNQIGLATGQVTELYDQGYVAKRMEIGAVIGHLQRKMLSVKLLSR